VKYGSFRLAAGLIALFIAALGMQSASAADSWVSSQKTIPIFGFADVGYGGVNAQNIGGGQHAFLYGALDLNVQARVGMNGNTLFLGSPVSEVKGSGTINVKGFGSGALYWSSATDWFHICGGGWDTGASAANAGCNGPDVVSASFLGFGSFFTAVLDFPLYSSNGGHSTLYVCVHMTFGSDGKLLFAWASFQCAA
jgi:hypothetical protein